MMQNISQTEEFLLFCLIGIILSFIFDIFRSIRKNFKSNDLITYIEDIIFLIIVTIIIMLGIIKISNGILRLYIFLGIILGIIIYTLTISKFCIIIMSRILYYGKKVFYFFINLFRKTWK